MDGDFWKRSALQIFVSALMGAVLSLLVLALAALFVKAYLPPQSAVTAVNWCVKCVAAFLPALICIRGERALPKGALSGVLFAVFTLILFSLIGGGFKADGFFALELVVCGILGGLGALLGAKFRKA